jgi:hypothetical protein
MNSTDADLDALPKTALLSTEEAAPLIGLRACTLTTWRSRSPERGPAFIRCGALIRYRAHDLRSWLEAHRSGGTRD